MIPRGDTAEFQVGPKAPFDGTFKVIVDWHVDDPENEVPKNEVGARWRMSDENGAISVKMNFLNLNAPLGGSLNKFGQFGKIGDSSFGFMVYFQTYNAEAASFTIQFMMEARDGQ